MLCLGGLCGPLAAGEVWVDIDTGLRSLTVMDDEDVLKVFENISIGRNGVTSEKVVKDRRTPLGSYRVRRINNQSRFRLYFGFDYPNLKQAQGAFRAGRITYDQLKAIRKAHYLKQEPPFDFAQDRRRTRRARRRTRTQGMAGCRPNASHLAAVQIPDSCFSDLPEL